MQNTQKTTLVRKEDAIAQRAWHLADVDGQVLGRIATQIASILRGKHKPSYTPHIDTGDFVVVVNAAKVRLTGDKGKNKIYRYHTGYIGGLRETTADKMIVRHPERMIRAAVWGMLPKNRLGRKMIKKLKIYAGPEHEHAAQQPAPLTFGR